MTITGQQKVMLNSYVKGKKKATDLYCFLRARAGEIPWDLRFNGTDHECIMWIYENSETKTDVHRSINWWNDFKNKYGIERYKHPLFN